jgi:hypothetical protein
MNRKPNSNGQPKKRQTAARVPLTVRLPENVLQQIDQDLGHRIIPSSRNTWLLEAAIEKLRKSGLGDFNGSK